ncbi:replication factor-A protein [Artemisia annua]|uniref:Replication factor-A protein n=1 Tax=Artemisia annua TaxID=35608 RepID=A0A2U1MTE2_ARTAN|nr:replication factor-A protein [Artemisia annua]
MAVNLTPGAITMLLSGRYAPNDPKPVLQVTDIQSLPFRPDRYEVRLSDGSFHHNTFLPSRSQLSELVSFIVIQNLDVILSECDIIGAPTLNRGNENPATEISISYPEESDADSDSNEDVDDSHHPQ